MKKSILKLLVVPAFFLLAASVYAWTEPTNAPPGPPGNVSAPVRTSGSPTVNFLGKITNTAGGGTIGNSQVFDDGTNVGIGTASPLGKLTIGSGNTAWTIGTGDVGTGAWIRNDGSNLVISTNIGNMYYGYSGNTKNLYFMGGGGTSQLTVLGASGNVGVGNLNPTYKLDVNGDVNVTGCFRVNGSCLSAGGGGTVGGSGSINTLPVWTGATTLGNSGVTQQGDGSLRITNGNGWAEIGPKNGQWNHLYTDRADTIVNTDFYSTTGNFSSYNGDLTLQTAGTARLSVLNSNGNVGIGMTNPGSKLDVAGDINTSGCYRMSGTCVFNFDSFVGAVTSNDSIGTSGFLYAQSAFINGLGPYGNTPVCMSAGSVGFPFNMNWHELGSCGSLRKYKENIKDLNLGLDTVMKLRPVTFDWKDPNMGGHDLGFIAEEVNTVDPILGQYSDGKLTGVKYTQMTAVLVKAAQDLQKENDQLKAQNDSLEARVAALEAKIK